MTVGVPTQEDFFDSFDKQPDGVPILAFGVGQDRFAAHISIEWDLRPSAAGAIVWSH
jgi:hypothetical protein